MENKWNDDQMKNEQDMRYQNLEKIVRQKM